jgi:hypothetical protein
MSDAGTNRTRLAVDAALKEYDFVSSLIPMYRHFEITAVQLSLVIFTAAAGFVASLAQDDRWTLILFVAGSLPLVLSLVTLAFAGMEMRIVRASRYIDRSLAPSIRKYAETDELILWEFSPSIHLTTRERAWAGSWPLVIVMSSPGWLGGTVGLVGGLVTPRFRLSLIALSLAGLGLLFFSCRRAITISGKHEEREASAPDPSHSSQKEE